MQQLFGYHLIHLFAVCALLLTACPSEVPSSGGSSAGGSGPIGGTEPRAGSDGQGGEAAMGGMGGMGGMLPTFDCATAPTAPVSAQILAGPKGYHGLAIDAAGLLYGLDESQTLGRAPYSGVWSPILANVYADQMEFGAGGDLFLALNGVTGINSQGQPYTVSSEIDNDTYGLRVGPDGMIYVAADDAIQRIDPLTGKATPFVETNLSSLEVHAFDFNREFDRLYVGNVGSPGILTVALDANLQPKGEVMAFALEDQSWIDGVAVDACGNVYAPNYTTSQLLKITPQGEVSVFVDWSGDDTKYGHAAIFGTGVGGFREDALYLPMPYNHNTVWEVVVGVPSRTFVGVVVNSKG